MCRSRCGPAPDSQELLLVLADFWNAGVSRVTPGAFGQHSRNCAYEFNDLEWVVNRTSGVRWEAKPYMAMVKD